MADTNVLVTGASTGIGEACALHLDRLGWRVFAGVRKQADADRLSQRASRRLVTVSLDVTDEAEVLAAMKTIDDEVGASGLSGLVNNAGVARGGPLEFLPLSEWRDQLEVNVVGQVAVTKAALPLLRRATGRVVFIGSIAGRLATPMVGPYAASKHAIEAIAESLRHEVAPWGIRVAVVEPGVVKTPIWSKGRTRADELEQSLGEEALALYRDQVDKIRAGIEKNDTRGIDASKVAEVVEHALVSPHPRIRYLVGPDAKVAGNLARLVPDRVRDALFRRLASL
ncbi:MAG TPA: SDR family oxidoreductase [Acidimicrobiales bacterium]